MELNTKPYPIRHDRDIWDAPEMAFMPGVSMTAGPAADILGLPRNTLIRWADDLGLTVLRRPPHDWRYFFISEIREVKERLDQIGILDLAELERFRDELPLLQNRKKKKKRRRRRKSKRY